MSAPSSQKADVRPISFVLWDRAAQLPPVENSMFIRPEELTRSDTSRMVVQQTLGNSPWIDSWGAGLPMITISGHTGWRPGSGASSGYTQMTAGSDDGLARMSALKESVFTQWHARRAAAMDAGLNPDLVELTFVDVLDGFATRVVPQSFVLRRSRSRPLLAQYQIQMQAIDLDIKVLPLDGQPPGIKEKLGLASLTDSINTIAGRIKDAKKWIDANLLVPVQSFMKMTQQLFNAVKNVVSSIDGVAQSLISVAQTVAQAGANLFRSLAMVASLPSLVKQRLMEVGSAYVNIFCVLRNSMALQKYTQDFSAILGSSGCSSTAGGAPVSAFASTNTFAAVAPTPAVLPVSFTPAALVSLSALAKADHINAPLSSSAIASAATVLSTGMKVSS